MTRLLRDIYESEYAVIAGHSEECRRQYRMTFKRWQEQMGQEPTLAHLDSLPVQLYVAHRKTQVKAATARKDRNQIAALWAYCAKRRYVEQFPTIPPVKAPGRIPRGYTVQDVSALLREAMRRKPPYKPTPIPPHIFMPTLIRNCWESAERIGSHMALRWRDVDTLQRVVVFQAENRKGATRDILRPISEEQCGWLNQMRRGDDELVWPWTGHRSTLWHHFGMICRCAGVTNRGFHGLRKSAASYVALAGGAAAASQLLDHSNPSTTHRHYLDETINKPKQTAVDLLPKLDLGDRPPEKPAA